MNNTPNTVPTTAPRRIADNIDYQRALGFLLAREVDLSRIEDEDSPEYEEATRIMCAAWNALAAVVDAHCAA